MTDKIVACRDCLHFIDDRELCCAYPETMPDFVDGEMVTVFPMVIIARSWADLCGPTARGYSPNDGISLVVDNDARPPDRRK